jgi:hypothetical protein
MIMRKSYPKKNRSLPSQLSKQRADASVLDALSAKSRIVEREASPPAYKARAATANLVAKRYVLL